MPATLVAQVVIKQQLHVGKKPTSHLTTRSPYHNHESWQSIICHQEFYSSDLLASVVLPYAPWLMRPPLGSGSLE